MWHVIVLILKIIGITLLAILGLLILLLLMGLLVPVRYEIDARKQEDIRLRAKVSWLLHMFSVPVVYEKGELHVRIKILGIPIKDLTADSREVKKESKKLAKDAQKGAEAVTDALVEDVEASDSTGKPLGSPDTADGAEKPLGSLDTADSTEKPLGSLDTVAKDQALAGSGEKIPASTETGKACEAGQGHKDSGNSQEEESAGREPGFCAQSRKKQKKFFLWRILSAFLEKLKKLKYTIVSICGKIRKGLKKAGDIKEFLMLDSTRAALSLCKVQIFCLLKKLGPRRVRGWIHFGMQDPALTGQILGGIGVFYAYFPKKLKLQPDFQQAVLEGELFIRGHFHGITLVGIAWRLWRDKNIRAVYKKIRSGF